MNYITRKFHPMGGKYSSLVPQTPTSTSYFALTFRKTDRIKLIYADKQVISVVQNAVVKNWSPGVHQMGKDKDGSFEIRFHNTPFSNMGPSDLALEAKRMCCEILTGLYVLGWRLVVSSDLSQITDLTTWFFHKDAPEYPTPRIICLSISSCDSIQLINAPESLRKVFKKAVIISYEHGVRSEQFYGKDYELKLKGYPWSTTDMEQSIMARKVILELFRRFDKQQFQFYGTANLKGTADCVFFIQTENYVGNNSVPTTPVLSDGDDYMMISLHQHDRMFLMDCPKSVVDQIRLVIFRSWKKGLQTESNYHLGWEFKLSGTPWWAMSEEAVLSRNLINNMFKTLLSSGVQVVACLDISHRTIDKSIFILKSCQPKKVPHFCLSLNEDDKIRLIDCDTDLRSKIRAVILDAWSYGLKKETNYFGSHEFKLAGNPWSSVGGNKNLVARKMMCHLLKALMELEWRVICSADVSAKYCVSSSNKTPEYPLDVHSWFFAKIETPKFHDISEWIEMNMQKCLQQN